MPLCWHPTIALFVVPNLWLEDVRPKILTKARGYGMRLQVGRLEDQSLAWWFCIIHGLLSRLLVEPKEHASFVCKRNAHVDMFINMYNIHKYICKDFNKGRGKTPVKNCMRVPL